MEVLFINSLLLVKVSTHFLGLISFVVERLGVMGRFDIQQVVVGIVSLLGVLEDLVFGGILLL